MLFDQVNWTSAMNWRENCLLQFSEHRVVVAAAANTPVVATADLRIEGITEGRGDGVRILMEDKCRATRLP